MQVTHHQLQDLEVGQTYQGKTVTQIRQIEHNPENTLAYDLTLENFSQEFDLENTSDPLDEDW
jgi:hypothetical protein